MWPMAQQTKLVLALYKCQTFVYLTFSVIYISFNLAPCPQFFDIFPKTIEYHLKALHPSINLVELNRAEVKVDVALDYGGKGDSVELCTKLYPDFHYKKKRILLGQTITEAKFEINRTHADQVLIAFRKLSIGMH